MSTVSVRATTMLCGDDHRPWAMLLVATTFGALSPPTQCLSLTHTHNCLSPVQHFLIIRMAPRFGLIAEAVMGDPAVGVHNVEAITAAAGAMACQIS